MPLVITIAKGSGTCFNEGDFSKLEDKAVFIDIPWRTGEIEESDSPVPQSKLLSENPSAAYEVDGKEPVVLVCDWYGNEFFRVEKDISVKELTKLLTEINDEVKDEVEDLEKYLEKANDELADGDIKGAIRQLHKNFKSGIVGHEPQVESIKVYEKMMEDGLVEAKRAHENGLTDALEGMKKTYRGTPLEPKIQELLDNPADIEGPVTQEKEDKN